MSRIKTLILTLCFATCLSAVPTVAEAGPLLDWLRGCCRRPANNCNTCNTGIAAAPRTQVSANYNPYNLQPGQCMKTCNQTCSRTVVNYVPYTAYRTNWQRIPVTQYRPVTNSDPCTGCTVTCMKPCTSYSWQMKQEPYTTYRPVYRQEQYSVPVTTITNDCATGACNTCNTCSTCPTGNCGVANTGSVLGAQSYAGAVTPTPVAPQVINNGANSTSNVAGQYYTYPQGQTLSTDGTYNAAPAAQTPAINVSPQSYQRQPLIDQFPTSNSSAGYWPRANQTQTISSNISPITDDPAMSAPAYINFEDKTARSPVRERWSYSPVRLASYTSNVEQRDVEEQAPAEIRRSYVAPVERPVNKPVTKPAKVNSGWETIEY